MDEASRHVLETRARALARVPAAPRSEGGVDLLVFRLAGERFGIETGALAEVFRARDIARLPQTEAPLIGVTVWRGELLELLDVRALLGLQTPAEDQLTHVAVLRADRAPLGLLMAPERGIASVPVSELRRAAEPRAGVRAVTRRGVQILDPAALLGHSEGSRT